MKVTFVEEIEQYRAFWPRKGCPLCGGFTSEIHHQIEPKEQECYWVKCSGCGRLGPEALTRELALSAWRNK
jgi:hypothetical protein